MGRLRSKTETVEVAAVATENVDEEDTKECERNILAVDSAGESRGLKSSEANSRSGIMEDIVSSDRLECRDGTEMTGGSLLLVRDTSMFVVSSSCGMSDKPRESVSVYTWQ